MSFCVAPDGRYRECGGDFATKQIRPIFEVDKDFSSGLSVSPDGRWILYSLLGDDSSDIMLVNGFR